MPGVELSTAFQAKEQRKEFFSQPGDTQKEIMGSCGILGKKPNPDVPPIFTDVFLSLLTGQTKTSAQDIPAVEHLKYGAHAGSGLCLFAP